MVSGKSQYRCLFFCHFYAIAPDRRAITVDRQKKLVFCQSRYNPLWQVGCCQNSPIAGFSDRGSVSCADRTVVGIVPCSGIHHGSPDIFIAALPPDLLVAVGADHLRGRIAVQAWITLRNHLGFNPCKISEFNQYPAIAAIKAVGRTTHTTGNPCVIGMTLFAELPRRKDRKRCCLFRNQHTIFAGFHSPATAGKALAKHSHREFPLSRCRRGIRFLLQF